MRDDSRREDSQTKEDCGQEGYPEQGILQPMVDTQRNAVSKCGMPMRVCRLQVE
jgi:hypothetical protein